MITPYTPPRVGCGCAAGLALLAVLSSASGGASLLVGVVGVVFTVAGLFVGRVDALALGSAFLGACVALAVVSGLPLEFALVAAVAAMCSYDVGEQSISLGRHTDDVASATTIELVTVAQSLSAGAVIGGGSYLALQVAPREGSGTVLAVLLLGIVIYVFGREAAATVDPG